MTRRPGIASGKDACKPLDDLVRRVVDEAGNERPKVTSAQAKALVNKAYAVEVTSGCRAASSMLPEAEVAVIDLIVVIDDFGLPRGVASDLRNRASGVGMQAAGGAGDACRKLDDLVRSAVKQLTSTQLTELTAAVSAIRTKLAC